VIFDPNAKRIIRSQDLHHNVDYTPYEGLEIEGWPLTVLSRGEVVIEKEKLLVAPGRGEFLVCNKPDMARPKVA
jgi:dihydropyrimidinase